MNAGLPSLEGRFSLELTVNRHGSVFGIEDVKLKPRSQPLVSRLMHRRSVEEVQQLLGMIFSLCGTAHRAASAQACESVMGLQVSEAVRQARSSLVEMEATREHLLHVLLRWSESLDLVVPNGLPGLFEPLRELSAKLFDSVHAQQRNAGLQAFLDTDWDGAINELENRISRDILGVACEEWLAIDHYAGLLRWSAAHRVLATRVINRLIESDWAGQCQTSVPALGNISAGQLKNHLHSEAGRDFFRLPEWQGKACENSSFVQTRQTALMQDLTLVFGNALLPRMVARLTELASAPALLRRRVGLARDLYSSHSLSSRPAWREQLQAQGYGEAWVQATRGQLLHRLVMANGRVSDYQVLAPTDWNFHPRGVVARGLRGICSNNLDELNQLAHLYIGSIDPCVGYDLVISEQVSRCA